MAELLARKSFRDTVVETRRLIADTAEALDISEEEAARRLLAALNRVVTEPLAKTGL